jgi:hypothetical protein
MLRHVIKKQKFFRQISTKPPDNERLNDYLLITGSLGLTALLGYSVYKDVQVQNLQLKLRTDLKELNIVKQSQRELQEELQVLKEELENFISRK